MSRRNFVGFEAVNLSRGGGVYRQIYFCKTHVQLAKTLGDDYRIVKVQTHRMLFDNGHDFH